MGLDAKDLEIVGDGAVMVGEGDLHRTELLTWMAPPPEAARPTAIGMPIMSRQQCPTDHHDLLMANLFAQAEALAFGKQAEELKAEGSPDFQTPFRVCEGDRPTNLILAEKLTPRAMGSLVALHEHGCVHAGRDLEHRLFRSVGFLQPPFQVLPGFTKRNRTLSQLPAATCLFSIRSFTS